MPNPVVYAERTLGVHIPWEQSQALLVERDELSRQLVTLRGTVRNLKTILEDRTMEIRSDAPSHPEWPAKGVQEREKFVKVLIFLDESVQETNSNIEDAQEKLDSADARIKQIEVSLHVLTARMNELSGLLHFYAAAKAAEDRITVSELSPAASEVIKIGLRQE